MMKRLLTLCSLVLLAWTATAQQTVRGVVSSPGGEPLIGVNVLEVGVANGTVTDLDGSYEIKVGANATLEFTYVGYVSSREVVAGRATINVSLQEGVALDEVVVTALGITREKKALTYASQEVSGAELTRVKDANVVNSLSGKAAGVFINRSASGVGGSARVVLRGNKSTRDNQPLYVIDGVPMFNFSPSQPTDVWGQANGAGSPGRDGGDAISNINPEDIESISVLKGASAAALYGSQAANGVILVTTKKGASGSSKITFSSNLTTETAIERPELQFAYGQTATGSLDSWGAKVNAADHVEDFFRTGQTWINSLAFTGGNQTAQTYFSYANTKSTSILPNSDFNRHSFSFRENASFLQDRLNLSATINFLTQKANNRPSSGLYFNPLTGLYFFPRGLNFNEYRDNYEVFSGSRNTFVQNWVADKDDQQNPYWVINRNTNTDVRNRLFSTVSAGLKLTDWLSVQARGNVDKTYDTYDQRAYASTQATLANSNGRYILQKSEGTQLYGDLIFLVSPKTTGALSVNATLGTSTTDTRFATDFYDSYNANLRFANVFSLQNINQPGATFQQSLTRRRLNAVFGSLQLGLNRSIYLDVTGRNDWSSTLAFTGNTSFFYPSVGVSAVLSEMMELPNIDFLKVRASYAVVGNDVTAYATNPLNTISSVNGLQVNTVGPLPGTELQPEKSKSLEAGLDIRMFSNRVSLDLTYYKTNTTNQFIRIGAPFGSGFSQYLINAGDIENKGIEAMLSITPVSTSTLEWTTNFNFTRNQNTIVSLSDELSNGTFYINDPGVNNYGMVIREGGSFGDILGKTFERDEKGNILVDDTGKPIGGALDIVGNPNPDFMLGWNNNIRMGNLSIGILFDGRFGGEVMSITQAMIDELGVSQVTADARDNGGIDVGAVNADDGSPAGSLNAQTFFQAVGGRAGITEYYVYDATNIRLRELSVSYKLPTSVVSKLGPIKGLQLSLVGRNLFFVMNNAPFDPDLSMSTGTGLQGVDVFSIPSTRSLGFNLTAQF